MAAPHAIDVYALRLEAGPAHLDYLFENLSHEERERALRFRFAEHRRQYIVSRGTLREILGHYLDQPSASLRFAENRYGKPSLRGSEIRFNVSHSGAWAMVAVAEGREVGIDIERVDPRFAQEQIPERFFSPREVAQLRGLPCTEQTSAFFRCWTRKEAYIKARGMGLALALDSFDVSLGPDEAPALHRAGGWSIEKLDAPPGYAAAIVAEGGPFTVSLCEFPSVPRFEAPALLSA